MKKVFVIVTLSVVAVFLLSSSVHGQGGDVLDWNYGKDFSPPPLPETVIQVPIQILYDEELDLETEAKGLGRKLVDIFQDVGFRRQMSRYYLQPYIRDVFKLSEAQISSMDTDNDGFINSSELHDYDCQVETRTDGTAIRLYVFWRPSHLVAYRALSGCPPDWDPYGIAMADLDDRSPYEYYPSDHLFTDVEDVRLPLHEAAHLVFRMFDTYWTDINMEKAFPSSQPSPFEEQYNRQYDYIDAMPGGILDRHTHLGASGFALSYREYMKGIEYWREKILNQFWWQDIDQVFTGEYVECSSNQSERLTVSMTNFAPEAVEWKFYVEYYNRDTGGWSEYESYFTYTIAPGETQGLTINTPYPWDIRHVRIHKYDNVEHYHDDISSWRQRGMSVFDYSNYSNYCN